MPGGGLKYGRPIPRNRPQSIKPTQRRFSLRGDIMNNRPRKTRTDSTANLLRVFGGANTQIAPPAHISFTEADWPYWHSVVDEFAKVDWTPHQLDVAAFLARTMAQLEAEQRRLSVEGGVCGRPDGSVITNPRVRAVDTLTAQVLSLRRSLGLTGRSKAGDTRNAVRQRSVAPG